MSAKTQSTPKPSRKKFDCKQCEFTTTTQGGLNRHVNAKHPVDNAIIIDSEKAPKRKRAAAKPKGKSNKVAAKKKGSRKLDPVKAYDFYFADNTRSYADVAKEFGVAKQTIENIAKITIKSGPDKGTWKTWAEHRQDLVEEAQKARDVAYRKSAPVRSEQHLLLYRNLQIAVSQKITAIASEGQILVDPATGKKVKVQATDARQLADVAKALKLAVDGERVIMGLPTSVSTIKPGADDETGKGWGELLALAMKQAANEPTN